MNDIDADTIKLLTMVLHSLANVADDACAVIPDDYEIKVDLADAVASARCVVARVRGK